MAGSPELVERLYRRLVGVAAEWPGLDEGALTIADLYQHLIPYRAVRGELGVLELAEYEDALLRLLAGEGGFLRVLDPDVRLELAAELSSPNPILGIYRDYAGVAVELSDTSGDRGGAAGASASPPGPPASDPDDRVPLRDFAAVAPPLMPADAARVASAVPQEPSPWDDPLRVANGGVTPAASAEPGGRDGAQAAERAPSTGLPAESAARPCVSCYEALPELEGVLFCPHCGTDQSAVPCGSCGTLIRERWNFCIRCGSRRPA